MARSRRTSRREVALSAHAYRDSALVYGVLALVIVGLALLTNGDVVRAVVIACFFFVVATGWSWWKFRSRGATGKTARPKDDSER
jgi:4-amino-4-deoxy-L-arabinose transferase-like glycosyltransferase